MNRYKMLRELKEFIAKLTQKYSLTSETISVKLFVQKHFCDSVIDRDVPHSAISHMITHLIRNRVCECLYLFHTEANVILSHKQYVIPLSIVKTDNEYRITLRTAYPERNSGNRNRTLRKNTKYIVME